jgi:hypothetical protein
MKAIDKKTSNLQVMVSKATRRKVEAKAKAAGVTVSQHLRYLIDRSLQEGQEV